MFKAKKSFRLRQMYFVEQEKDFYLRHKCILHFSSLGDKVKVFPNV